MLSMLDILGLHPADIEHVDDIIETFLKDHSFSVNEIDDIYDKIKDDINSMISSLRDIEDLENMIINSMLSTVSYELEEKGIIVDFCVNGYCSDIWEAER